MNNRDDSRIDTKGLDTDGLPAIGKKLTYGTPEMLIYDTVN